MEKEKVFLDVAKTKTYATGEVPKVKLGDGANEFTYAEGNLTYRDRYYGTLQFLGEEVLFKDGEAIWGMNYWGDTLPECEDIAAMVTVLKKALAVSFPEHPYRGPLEYTDGDYVYTNEIDGSFEHFSGVETIRNNGIAEFKLYYHGGLIKG